VAIHFGAVASTRICLCSIPGARVDRDLRRAQCRRRADRFVRTRPSSRSTVRQDKFRSSVPSLSSSRSRRSRWWTRSSTAGTRGRRRGLSQFPLYGEARRSPPELHRPRDPAVAGKLEEAFPNLELLTVRSCFWRIVASSRDQFNDCGCFAASTASDRGLSHTTEMIRLSAATLVAHRAA